MSTTVDKKADENKQPALLKKPVILKDAVVLKSIHHDTEVTVKNLGQFAHDLELSVKSFQKIIADKSKQYAGWRCL